ncbi:PH domain-containing protein [Pedobacter sp.]|nr:PH domain-containing protein [Candidatus Saccharibacteria bacterium]
MWIEKHYYDPEEAPPTRYITRLVPCLAIGVGAVVVIMGIQWIDFFLKAVLATLAIPLGLVIGLHLALRRDKDKPVTDPRSTGFTPPKRVASSLLRGEHLVVMTHKHLAETIFSLAGLIVITLGAGYLVVTSQTTGSATFIGIIWLATGGYLAYKTAESRIVLFAVTDQRVLLFTGVLTTRISQMSIAKLTDLSREKPLLGRILGFGTLIPETAGQDQGFSRVAFLPDIDGIFKTINRQLFSKRATPEAEE